MGCACGWRFWETEAGVDEEEDLRRENLGRGRKNSFVIFYGGLLISPRRIIYKNRTNRTGLYKAGRAFM
jgi:hypothetical protein